MTLGQSLQVGDFVDITLTSPKAGAKSEATVKLFENILILDIQQSQISTPSNSDSSVIVLGVPKDDYTEFAKRYVGATLLIRRRWDKTIIEVAIDEPSLSTFVTAIKAAGLVATLSGKGSFTVFAPTNRPLA